MIDIRDYRYLGSRSSRCPAKRRARMACTVLALTASLASGIVCADEEIGCPERIRLAQTVQESPSGWSPVGDESWHPVVNVRFSEGDPSQQLFLRPTVSKPGKEQDLRIWNFTPANNDYWVSCAYAQTGAIVARKLPPTVRTCEVESYRKSAESVSIRLSCQ